MRTLPADRHRTRARDCIARTVLVVLSLAGGLPCRAGSAFESGPPSGPAVRARAHLDFRITVLPALALLITPERLRIEANSGGVTMLQHMTADHPNGKRLDRNIQLRALREIVVTELRAMPARAEMVTVASP